MEGQEAQASRERQEGRSSASTVLAPERERAGSSERARIGVGSEEKH